jgi:hypothetical protein
MLSFPSRIFCLPSGACYNNGLRSRKTPGGNRVDHNQVLELEEACERVLAEVLRKHYAGPVGHRTRHLMAKAAIAVLEAVDEAKSEE